MCYWIRSSGFEDQLLEILKEDAVADDTVRQMHEFLDGLINDGIDVGMQQVFSTLTKITTDNNLDLDDTKDDSKQQQDNNMDFDDLFAELDNDATINGNGIGQLQRVCYYM